jgi:hypothetical protein
MRVLIETHAGDQGHVERELAGNANIEAMLAEIEGREDTTVSLGLSPRSDDVEVIVGITSDGYLLTRYHKGDAQQLIGCRM